MANARFTIPAPQLTDRAVHLVDEMTGPTTGIPAEHVDDAEVHELRDRLRKVEFRAWVRDDAGIPQGE